MLKKMILKKRKQWDMYVMSSDKCKILLREPKTTERAKATKVGILNFEDDGSGPAAVFTSNGIIPDYMSSYYLHEWKPAVTVFLYHALNIGQEVYCFYCTRYSLGI